MSEEIKKMFSGISKKYDLLNDLLSFGIHRLWRRQTVKTVSPGTGNSILDLACGTGDFAIAFKKALRNNGKVTAIDFSPEMTEIARRKAQKHGLEIEFKVGDALNTGFQDNSFDITSIALGIRNTDSPELCLKEMARVVKPGGKVVVLEFGKPEELFRIIYKPYSKFIIPLIGRIVSGSSFAYTYLPDSAAKFPCGESFLEIMRNSNCFTRCYLKILSFGIVYIYIGVVK